MMKGPFGDRGPGRSATRRGGRVRRHGDAAALPPTHPSGASQAMAGAGRAGQDPPGAPARRTPNTRSVERRGRGPRGSILPRSAPARLTPAAAFDQIAIAAFSEIDARWHDRLTGLDIAVDDVPGIRARNPQTVVWPPEVVADGAVPLARLVPAGLTRSGDPTRARLVLFRRPLELRAVHPADLMLLIHDVMVEQVADYLGVTPEIVDPTLRDD